MQEIPPKWKKKYLLKRIDEEDIEIPKQTRDKILEALASGKRFVQVGEYTIMLNAIKSIDPYWPPYNIPPKPKGETDLRFENGGGSFEKVVINQKEIDLWEKIFGGSREELPANIK